MDPFGHPDLERLGRSLRNTLHETLDAEQTAARAAALRRRTLRDRLIESEDRDEEVVVVTVDGHVARGAIDAVGVDHVVLRDGPRERIIATTHIISVETR